MNRFLATMAAGVVAFCVAPVCLADTVFLKNGDEINGKIVEEGDNAIVIKEEPSGRLVSVSRARIDVIVYDKKPGPETLVAKAPEAAPAAPTETSKPSTDPKKEGEKKTSEPEKKTSEPKEGAKTPDSEKKTGDKKEGEKTGEGDKKEGESKTGAESDKKEGDKKEGDKKEGEKKEVKKNRPDYTPEEKKKFEELMQALDNDDPNARAAAQTELGSLGTKAIAAIVDGLQHKRVEARAACATLLGQMNARNAVKQLLEVFYAAMPDKGEAATYQIPFIRALKVAMSATTGQSFINVEPDKPLVQEGLKKYIAWYNENFDRLPPQIDEELIEPTDPDYMKKLKEQRALKLEKKEWPKPPLSVERAVGARKTPEAPVQRGADLDYEKGLPKTDRERAGGLIRDADKSFGDDFFKRKDQ
ncbi:MAG: HEAT repeat domain-containing protein [Planctomycetes bacterium]|nr:HEAT repeat domain-containing protein [Planctomycetota bacterium]